MVSRRYLQQDHVELARRADSLASLLLLLRPQGLKFSVGTVCRSVRDGYTPRRGWIQIEKAVLAVLEKTGDRVHFDEGLLGGLDGRPL